MTMTGAPAAVDLCLDCLARWVTPEMTAAGRRYACPCGNTWTTIPTLSIKEIEMPPETYDVDRFTADTSKHELTVLRDDGLYRHLRFAPPRAGFYWFDLVTWPGYLTVVGGARGGAGFTFNVGGDPFPFFRHPSINPQYWATKLAGGKADATAYSEDKFRAMVLDDVKQQGDDYPGLLDAVQEQVLDTDDHATQYEEGAREALDAFVYPGLRHMLEVPAFGPFKFRDTWEWNLDDWSWEYLWCLNAIRWGIGEYDANRSATVETAVAA